ncbi:DUF3833 domain-containing protein [Gemmobacter aquarius]|uniref:DUF3833 domain-containing protein n=1 Tax=Paragemmobacter aquarius TaxID=2169400 RepID=A0A2S0UQ44_9RHOB|nr:DUF3833 domain-containing protein [Gemmobacter aquarius]AWB49938.1 DUF3833 domain-containing protein [Gemmobacter aquarius]
MEFFILLLVVVAAVLVLPKYIGFRSQKPADLSAGTPRFDLRAHLSGPILCEGVIYGPTGRVSSRFVAEMEGHWDGNRGVLKERFRYDSGRVQDREWRLTVGNDGRIRAEADDVIGTGSGVSAGAAVQLKYRIKLDPDAGGHVLDVVDWMYVMENGTIMNRSQFRKFGIKVAELVATMRPMPAAVKA